MIIQKDVVDKRFEYSGSNVIYMGKSTVHKAATSEDHLWDIYKFTWDLSGNCTRIEGPIRGNWTDRAALGWA